MLTLLIALFVFCVVYWCAVRLMAAFGVGDPVATVVQIVIVVAGLLWLVSFLGYGGTLRLR